MENWLAAAFRISLERFDSEFSHSNSLMDRSSVVPPWRLPLTIAALVDQLSSDSRPMPSRRCSWVTAPSLTALGDCLSGKADYRFAHL